MQYWLEERKQKSRGSSRNRFGGPDMYVAVQVVPDDEIPLIRLDAKAAERRGIKIIYCGEGYSKHQGERSMYGRALAKALAYIKEHDQEIRPEMAKLGLLKEGE